jgi:hypothetical protein
MLAIEHASHCQMIILTQGIEHDFRKNHEPTTVIHTTNCFKDHDASARRVNKSCFQVVGQVLVKQNFVKQ